MDDGPCPRCGGKEILTHQPGFLAGERAYLSLGNWPWLRPVEVRTRICTDCGFLESYAGRDDLPALKERWLASRHPLED